MSLLSLLGWRDFTPGRWRECALAFNILSFGAAALLFAAAAGKLRPASDERTADEGARLRKIRAKSKRGSREGCAAESRLGGRDPLNLMRLVPPKGVAGGRPLFG